MGDETGEYDNPTDIGFLKDIDPTIVPHLNSAVKAQDQTQAWILGPNITIPSTPGRRAYGMALPL